MLQMFWLVVQCSIEVAQVLLSHRCQMLEPGTQAVLNG